MAGSPRRSPAPDARQRDAERTREALLDAALAEFGAKGLAGARTSEIAERAGVNKQLISYYFGGKDGLYKAILDRWYAQEDAAPGARHQPRGARLALPRGRPPPARPAAALHPRGARAGPGRGGARADRGRHRGPAPRQAEGEIADELDPAFVLLVLQTAVLSGIVFPREVKRLMGMDPGSPEFLEHMGQQLRLLVRRLA